MNFHTKYRPATLDEVIGNREVVASLRAILDGKKDVPRAILFHGPTGCGKTTLARIFARGIGVAEEDLVEVDSADFRGVDTIREIRRQSSYMPLYGQRRAWILDECHRMTPDAQSALLKALEDSPEHVCYILCTTDPQKLLPTILGRCVQYQVQPLTDLEMKQLIRRVVKAEGESLDKEVYEHIVTESEGHPREALQLLAQILSVEPEERSGVIFRTKEVSTQAIELCRLLLKPGTPWKQVAEVLKALENEDSERIRRAVLGYCKSILLSDNHNVRAAEVMECFFEPTFNTGFPGIVLAAYSAVFGQN